AITNKRPLGNSLPADPSTLLVAGRGAPLGLCVTEAGNDLPLVFPFETGQSAVPGARAEAPDLGSEEEAVAGLTSVGEFNLSFVPTLLGIGMLGAGNSNRSAPRDADPTVAQFVPGQEEGLAGNESPGGGSGEGLPLEALIPLLFEMVQDWAPATGRDYLAAVEGVAEAIAQSATGVRVPLQRTLESLGVPEEAGLDKT